MRVLKNLKTLNVKKFTFVSLILLLVFSTGCKSHKKINRQDEIQIGEIVTVKKGKTKIGDQIAKEAVTWLGTPYKYGGDVKGEGTDCSGLVMRVYLEVANLKLPRNSAKQAEFCEELKENKVDAGDLVFFAIGKNPDLVSHVGIMLDNCRFIHASSSKGVIISEMTTPYYKRNFKKYGRVPR